MAGFENDVLLLKNINFDYKGAPPNLGIVSANGQLLIGNTTNPDIAMTANTLTAGTGISITNGPGTITIASSSGGVSVDSFDVQAATAPGTDPVVPTAAGLVTVNGAAVANHSVVLETRSRAANAYNLEVQYGTSAAATDATKSGVVHLNSAQFSVDANGFVSSLGAMTDLHTARYIVSAGGTADGANYTTIATAYAAAVTASAGGTVPQTVFIQPGTYTENITMSPGVNLSAFQCDSFDGYGNNSNVRIVGKITMTATGNATVSGIQIVTNNDFAIQSTGSNTLTLTFINCNIISGANSATYSISCSNGNATINLWNCQGNLSAASTAYANMTGGSLNIQWSLLGSGGGSTTNSLAAGGNIVIYYSLFQNAITSSTGGVNILYSWMALGGGGQTCLTFNNNSSNFVRYTKLDSGSASTIVSNSSGTNKVVHCEIDTSNTNAFSGSGTITTAGNLFVGTTSNISTTTQALYLEGPSRSIGSANSGGTNTFTVTNSSNTASSNANIVATVGGTSSADAFYQAVVAGTTTWSWGVDNSDSDAWVLSASATPGTTNVMRVATTGEINFPLQSAFLAYVNTTINNVTGDSTVYSIIYDTEIYDQNADFNLGTSVFTAPITGRYFLNQSVLIVGATVIGSGNARIVTSNRTYNITLGAGASLSTQNASVNESVLADMDAADTATVTVFTTDSGGKVDDVSGTTSGDLRTWISGNLEC